MPFTLTPTLQGVGQQLAQSRPSNTANTSLYSPAADIAAEITHIFVMNWNPASATFRIFHDEDGSTYNQATALFYDVSVPGNTTLQLETTIFMLNSSGNLAVQTGTANGLTFTAYGKETRLKAR